MKHIFDMMGNILSYLLNASKYARTIFWIPKTQRFQVWCTGERTQHGCRSSTRSRKPITANGSGKTHFWIDSTENIIPKDPISIDVTNISYKFGISINILFNFSIHDRRHHRQAIRPCHPLSCSLRICMCIPMRFRLIFDYSIMIMFDWKTILFVCSITDIYYTATLLHNKGKSLLCRIHIQLFFYINFLFLV